MPKELPLLSIYAETPFSPLPSIPITVPSEQFRDHTSHSASPVLLIPEISNGWKSSQILACSVASGSKLACALIRVRRGLVKSAAHRSEKAIRSSHSSTSNLSANADLANLTKQLILNYLNHSWLCSAANWDSNWPWWFS